MGTLGVILRAKATGRIASAGAPSSRLSAPPASGWIRMWRGMLCVEPWAKIGMGDA